ncbi:MAG TPA: hypothetical protein VK540_01910 [Polyangiaceae bacterium]|jgi:hypothetical protein|nr:hypothetical protein [Polyangiaceae bacterium]
MTTNHAVIRASRFRRFLAIGIAIAGASCASRPVTLGQTQIGQGKLYQSGSVTYDRFFQDTHAVQLDVMRADEDEAAARGPLEKALDARGASLEKLYELAVARAKKGSEDGPPLVYVMVSGLEPNKESKEPSENGDAPKEGTKEAAHDAKEPPKKVVVTVAPLDTVAADQKPFIKAFTETARGEAEILDRFGQVAAKAAQLTAHSEELSEGVDKEFSARKLRKDVNQELGAARLILGATQDRAREISTRARAFLKGLSEALKPPTEAAPAPPPPPPTPADKPAAKPTTRSRRGSGGSVKPTKPTGAETAPPTRSETPPPAKPAAPKPKPAEDFNP